MGCDIHMYAEVKKNGEWRKVGKIFDNPFYDPEENLSSSFFARKTDHPYQRRNYLLFSILANVRNAEFVYTEYPLMPKGLPKDVSEEVKKKSDENIWGNAEHSHSWLTLKELIDIKWKQYQPVVNDFVKKTIPDLQKLGNPKDVRIVFWFDN